MRLRAVFFDLDQTLFPAEQAYRRGLRSAWRALREREPVGWERFQSLYARARQRVKARLKSSPSARSRLLYFKQLVEDLSGRPRPALVLAMMRAYDRAWPAADLGASRRVAAALAGSYTLGILTNLVCDTQLRKMLRLDPDGRLFRVLITSEELGVEKPQRAMFREACRRAGCRPGEALMVGDDWEHDVLGSLRAGLRAVWLRPPGSPERRLPAGAARIDHLSELPAVLGGAP
ncbi:MAG: hypothetical protein A2X36_17330 [Elusimicrobia bacterium GWA2_69_24]|nr:MAG: hypothetical protein A2X36_17330 [Elusimicrobia bacterium GWA2_69_24]